MNNAPERVNELLTPMWGAVPMTEKGMYRSVHPFEKSDCFMVC